MIENIKTQLLCSPLAFGVLPGWWRSVEAHRQSNPLVDEAQWHLQLWQSGFDPRLRIHDTDEEANQEMASIIARVREENDVEPKCLILQDPASSFHRELAESLSNSLGRDTEVRGWGEVTVDMLQEDVLVVSLVGLRGVHLSDVTRGEFEKIRLLLETCTYLLWLSEDPIDEPRAAMGRGPVRTCRWERDQEGVNLVTASICNPFPSLPLLSVEISRIVREAFNSRNAMSQNAEYSLRDGLWFTNRLLPASMSMGSSTRQTKHSQSSFDSMPSPIQSIPPPLILTRPLDCSSLLTNRVPAP